jgi:hypothetical protein
MNNARNFKHNRASLCLLVVAIVLFLCFCLNIRGAQALDSESGPKSDDYLGAILTNTNGKVFRFQNMPVSVFIESDRVEERAACEQAFSLWRERTDSLIAFERVLDKKSARVLIKFVSLPLSADALSNGGVDGGHTLMEWHFQKRVLRLFDRGKAHVPPQIVEVNLSAADVRPASQRALVLQNIIAHELGHAIGLLSHSLDQGDLMYSQVDENSKLSPRDLDTVRKLYRLKASVYL